MLCYVMLHFHSQCFEEQVRCVEVDEPHHELDLSVFLYVHLLEILAASRVQHLQPLITHIHYVKL